MSDTPGGPPLVLSIFPGIDLLGRAFEEEGFCVVRGPDLLWGGDIRTFHPPAGVFDGVIGGPPCQFASRGQTASRRKTPMPPNLIPEFERVVAEAQPGWWVMETVPRAPRPEVAGYSAAHQLLNNRFFGAEQDRIRRFTFATRSGTKLVVDVVAHEHIQKANCVVASEGAKGFRPNGFRGPYIPRRPWAEVCRLQGLPPDFLWEAPFTLKGKYVVLGNGVPLPMGRAMARAVKMAMGYE